MESKVDLVPGYRIEAQLAQGGMSTVYRAIQISLNRPVAIKILARRFAERDPTALDITRRFLAEAHLAARISDSHVVRVLDSGTCRAGLFIVYEFIAGRTLRALLGPGLAPAALLQILQQAAQGLNAIHTAGAIHRDVKPENMLVDDSARLKLADLGIAKDLGHGAVRTQTGVLYGTPVYMSPEHCRGEDVGPASDLYSLGVVLYEGLVGRPPFEHENSAELLKAHLTLAPIPPSQRNSALPRLLDDVTLKALAKMPGDRFDSAGRMVAAMQDCLEQLQRPDRLPPNLRPIGDTQAEILYCH